MSLKKRVINKTMTTTMMILMMTKMKMKELVVASSRANKVENEQDY